MSTSQQEGLETETPPSLPLDHLRPPGFTPSGRPVDGSVRQLIARLSDLEDRMREAPVFLPAGGGRARAIDPHYLDLLLEQARVIAALRARRRRR